MEALRSLQGKCSISPGVLALLACFCAVIVVAGLCATAKLRKKRADSAVVHEENPLEQRNSGCGAVKKAWIGSVLWSRGSKWEESGEAEGGQSLREVAVLELPANTGERRGTSLSPVWQRRILMGERCEMPRFSGLILYDERGRPLHSPGAARQVWIIHIQKACYRLLLFRRREPRKPVLVLRGQHSSQSQISISDTFRFSSSPLSPVACLRDPFFK